MSRISKAQFTHIEESATCVSVPITGIALKKMGKNFTGCCPFHDEETASFVVNPATRPCVSGWWAHWLCPV